MQVSLQYALIIILQQLIIITEDPDTSFAHQNFHGNVKEIIRNL